MTEPLSAIGNPTTTILKPESTDFGYMTVTKGPSRSATTILLPVGVSLIMMDFFVPRGTVSGQLRGLIGGSSEILNEMGVYTGISSEMITLVNDDPLSWFGFRGNATTDALANSRIAITIYPMLAV